MNVHYYPHLALSCPCYRVLFEIHFLFFSFSPHRKFCPCLVLFCPYIMSNFYVPIYCTCETVIFLFVRSCSTRSLPSLPPPPLQSRFRKFALHQTLSFSAVYTVVSRFSFFCLCFPPKYAIANMNPKVPHPLSHDRTAKALRGTLRLSLLYLSTDPFFTQRHGSKSLLILLMNDLRLGAVWPPFHHRKRRMPSGILRNASTMVPSKLQCSSQV